MLVNNAKKIAVLQKQIHSARSTCCGVSKAQGEQPMLSSSLKIKTMRSAALCAVLLFSPATFCTWNKLGEQSARNHALISASILAVAPVLDGVLKNAGSLSSLEGWQKLPKALRKHISRSLFAEGIEARKEDENFFAHKGRFVGTYAKENPVFLIALAFVVASATDALHSEYNRLASQAQPNLANKLKETQDKLTAANTAQSTAQKDLDAAKAEVARLQEEATTAAAAKTGVDSDLATRTEELARAQAALTEATSARDALQTRVAELDAEKAALTEQMTKLKPASADVPVGAGASSVFGEGAGGALRAASRVQRGDGPGKPADVDAPASVPPAGNGGDGAAGDGKDSQ